MWNVLLPIRNGILLQCDRKIYNPFVPTSCYKTQSATKQPTLCFYLPRSSNRSVICTFFWDYRGKILNGKCEEKNCLRNQLDLSLFTFIIGTALLVLEQKPIRYSGRRVLRAPACCYAPTRFWKDVCPCSIIAIFIVMFKYHKRKLAAKRLWKR